MASLSPARAEVEAGVAAKAEPKSALISEYLENVQSPEWKKNARSIFSKDSRLRSANLLLFFPTVWFLSIMTKMTEVNWSGLGRGWKGGGPGGKTV